ncbi:MAG: glutamine--tRNA ligase [Candidatus Adiutrix intracellularis]|jgi:glutaminyl-tRNA synthetase|nr:MAG: glutamine--tRNA ligase [Candidatus Adiutrix intracellularis]MDR2826634.1 glutamine--tRNA ligase/YqeY domain fusion protein [Candidatus Adiutrix intracellularis]
MSLEIKNEAPNESTGNFIRTFIDEDLLNGRYPGTVTRFPPEPNGYLHIGHAKSICLNFGLAVIYNGACNLRFDDTNPVREDVEYIDSIKKDVSWLGFTWTGSVRYASDYFEQIYTCTKKLIQKGLAYVDDLSQEEVRNYRGTLTKPGQNSPWRNRTAEENLFLFRRMRAGEFPDGSRSLRAKIDMTSPNINLRDPTLYRIRKAIHHRTGDEWPIYPMYDYTHCISDAIEGITHSICTLEFEDHRSLYDWVLEALDWPPPRPRQIEFARLNLEYTIMSKRKLLQLVKDKYVEGWDDPRLPTIAAFRRRGFTPESIRLFCDRIGIAKRDSWIEYYWLEKAIRDDLNSKAPRVMAVLNPLKAVIENWPKDQTKEFQAPYFPDDPNRTSIRPLIFEREIYIEAEDFMLDPPKKFYRLGPGREVHLRWGFYIHCHEAVRNEDGTISKLRCTYSEEPRGFGAGPGGQPAIIHWVPAKNSIPARVRLYDRLFKVPRPKGNLDKEINPNSLREYSEARLEPALRKAGPGERWQFERLGYFITDEKLHTSQNPTFNRIVTLKDKR